MSYGKFVTPSGLENTNLRPDDMIVLKKKTGEVTFVRNGQDLRQRTPGGSERAIFSLRLEDESQLFEIARLIALLSGLSLGQQRALGVDTIGITFQKPIR